MMLAFLLPTSMQWSAAAAYDLESSEYGFSIDLDNYKKPKWYNTVLTNNYLDGYIIGVVSTDIGVTRAKNKTSDGKYMDQVMVRCNVKGKYPALYYAGYCEALTIKSTLPAKTQLMSYSPTQEASSVSYDIGLEASSDKTVGISATQSFTKDALKINNYSDTSIRKFETGYDYQHHDWRWNWGISVYSYNESQQLAHYVIKTSASKYTTTIVVVSKFQRWSKPPTWWADQYSIYTTTATVMTLTTPY